MPTVQTLTKTPGNFWVPQGVTSIDVVLKGGGYDGATTTLTALAVTSGQRFAYSIGLGSLTDTTFGPHSAAAGVDPGKMGSIVVTYTFPDPDQEQGNLSLTSYLETRLSGGATNTNPDVSLGGAVSFYAPRQLIRGNVFADVTEAQRVAGLDAYRCLYLENTHPTLSMANLTLWLEDEPSNAGTAMTIGADPTGINGTAATIANETTAPGGVTFSGPTSYAAGINLGTLLPGDHVAFWVRRNISAGAAATVFDRLLLGLQFD